MGTKIIVRWDGRICEEMQWDEPLTEAAIHAYIKHLHKFYKKTARIEVTSQTPEDRKWIDLLGKSFKVSVPSPTEGQS